MRKNYIATSQLYGGYIHQLKYSSRKVAHLWFKALIVTSKYPVEYNYKGGIVVIVSYFDDNDDVKGKNGASSSRDTWNHLKII